MRHERLLSDWEAAMRLLAAAQPLDRPALLDDMPRMLSLIADWIERGSRDDLSAIEELACVHTRQRLCNGLDLRQAFGEYRILRHSIVRLLTDELYRDGHCDNEAIDSFERLNEATDAAIAASVDCYSHARERASREVELQLRRVLATLPVAVWVADGEGTIKLSNEAARRLWGGERHVALDDYDQFKAWWPDGRRLTSSDWGLSRALRTGEVTVDQELKIEGFDGSRKIIRNSAAPIVDDSGRIVGGVAVNEDITQLKLAEDTRDLFVGILGHDLRSPLSAITMAASLLLRRGELAESQRQVLARVQSSAARIQQLIDSLLDFTRARFGMGFPINPTAVDIGDVCVRIVDELRTAHPRRTIHLERSGNLSGVWDGARVAQVISNLVGNAVEHGKDPIAVAAKDAGDAVLVSVSNRGAPIPEQKRAWLFEPFRKGEDSKGIGLGLFIARDIVRSHGGTIEAVSTEEATTFTTRWPRT